MTDVAGPPSLQVQTVLYRPVPGAVDRFLRGLGAATDLARSRGWFGPISLVVGDCSPRRTFTAAEAAELADRMAGHGVDRSSYRFFDANLGSAAGHNALLADLDAELLLIVNPDVYCSPTVLGELLAPLDDPAVGVVEARQVPVEHPKAHDPVTGDTSWVSTACVLVRAEVVRALGGFDAETFFLYCDDVDFSWRARLAGWRVVHHPPATVFHDKRLGGDGVPVAGDAELYYSAEAALLMAWKYSRPDLVARWTEELEATGLDEHRRAVAAFQARQQAGRLPDPLDPDRRVAEFHDHDYAEHRFSYRA